MKPTECPACEAEYLLRTPIREKAEEIDRRVGPVAKAAYVNGRLGVFHEQHSGKPGPRIWPKRARPKRPVATVGEPVDPATVARWREWLASMGETGPGGARISGGQHFPAESYVGKVAEALSAPEPAP